MGFDLEKRLASELNRLAEEGPGQDKRARERRIEQFRKIAEQLKAQLLGGEIELTSGLLAQPPGKLTESTPGKRTAVEQLGEVVARFERAMRKRQDALVPWQRAQTFDDYRASGLRDVLARIDNRKLRSATIAAADPAIAARAGESQSKKAAASKASAKAAANASAKAAANASAKGAAAAGQAMWGAAERRAATLYRHAQDAGDVASEDPIVDEALARCGSGQALPAAVRKRMENELGISLERVRVHTDPVAAAAARAVRAQAFTVGEDIFFAERAYSPESKDGQKLLAHELTHVVQAYQGRTAAGGGSGISVSQPGESLEREADAMAERIATKPNRSVNARAGRTGEPGRAPRARGSSPAMARPVAQPAAQPARSTHLMRRTEPDSAAPPSSSRGERGPNGERSHQPRTQVQRDHGEERSQRQANRGEERIRGQAGELAAKVSNASKPGINQVKQTVATAKAQPPGKTAKHEGQAHAQHHKHHQDEAKKAHAHAKAHAHTETEHHAGPERKHDAPSGDVGPVQFKKIDDWQKYMPEALPDQDDRERKRIEALVKKQVTEDRRDSASALNQLRKTQLAQATAVRALAPGLQGQIKSAEASAIGKVTTSEASQTSAVQSHVAGVQAQVRATATQVKAQIASAHQAAVGAINTAKQAATQKLTQSKTKAMSDIDQAMAQELTAVAAQYSATRSQIVALGSQKGSQASGLGDSISLPYDGDKLDAARKAAREVAGEYASAMPSEASKAADEVCKSQPDAEAQIRKIAADQKKQIEEAFKQSKEVVDQAAEQAKTAVDTIKDQSTQQLDQTASTTISQLATHGATQVAAIRQQATGARTGIQRASASAQTAVGQSCTQAATGIEKGTKGLLKGAKQIEAPNPEETRQQVRDGIQQLNQGSSQIAGGLQRAAQTSGAQLGTQATQAAGGMQETAAQAKATATQMGSGAQQAMTQLGQGASQGLQQVGENYQQSAQKIGSDADKAMTEVAAKTKEAYTALTNQVRTNLQGAVTQITSSFNEAVPTKETADILANAKKAADAVKPWWQKALAFVVSIVVAIVVVVVVTALIVTTGPVGAILVAAAAGALGSVLGQMASNLVLGNGLMEGVTWQTVAMGAIGGAVGAGFTQALSSGAGALAAGGTRFAGAGSRVATALSTPGGGSLGGFAIKTGVGVTGDFVSDTASQLIVTGHYEFSMENLATSLVTNSVSSGRRFEGLQEHAQTGIQNRVGHVQLGGPNGLVSVHGPGSPTPSGGHMQVGASGPHFVPDAPAGGHPGGQPAPGHAPSGAEHAPSGQHPTGQPTGHTTHADGSPGAGHPSGEHAPSGQQPAGGQHPDGQSGPGGQHAPSGQQPAGGQHPDGQSGGQGRPAGQSGGRDAQSGQSSGRRQHADGGPNGGHQDGGGRSGQDGAGGAHAHGDQDGAGGAHAHGDQDGAHGNAAHGDQDGAGAHGDRDGQHARGDRDGAHGDQDGAHGNRDGAHGDGEGAHGSGAHGDRDGQQAGGDRDGQHAGAHGDRDGQRAGAHSDRDGQRAGGDQAHAHGDDAQGHGDGAHAQGDNAHGHGDGDGAHAHGDDGAHAESASASELSDLGYPNATRSKADQAANALESGGHPPPDSLRDTAANQQGLHDLAAIDADPSLSPESKANIRREVANRLRGEEPTGNLHRDVTEARAREQARLQAEQGGHAQDGGPAQDGAHAQDGAPAHAQDPNAAHPQEGAAPHAQDGQGPHAQDGQGPHAQDGQGARDGQNARDGQGRGNEPENPAARGHDPNNRTPVHEGGLADPAVRENFSNKMRELQSEWGKLPRPEREARIREALNEQMRAAGLPELNIDFVAMKHNAGELRFDSWTVAINESAVDARFMSRGRMQDLIDTTLHEARHGEQWYMMARHLGSQGLDAPSIARRMGFPEAQVRAALADPRPMTLEQQNAARKYYESVYGSNARYRNDVINSMNSSEPYKQARSEYNRIRKDPNATPEQIEAARMRMEEMNHIRKNAYDLYRQLPEERDAWAVGNSVGDHYQESTPNIIERTWNRIQGNDPMTGERPANPRAAPGDVPRQSHTDLDQLYRDAGVAQRELSTVTQHIADELHGRALIPDKLKGRERAQQKIDADYDGDPSRITDLARSSIEFDNPQQIRQAMDKLRERGEIVRVKDRFEKPADGYRDVMINMRMSNGHIVEVQLHLKAILDVKNGPGHALYEQVREIDARANKEGRELTPDESARKRQLVEQMRSLYDQAFEQSQASGSQPAAHAGSQETGAQSHGPQQGQGPPEPHGDQPAHGQQPHGDQAAQGHGHQQEGELPQGDRGPTQAPESVRPRRPRMAEPGSKDIAPEHVEGGTPDGSGRMVRLRDPERYSKFIHDASPLHKAISEHQRYEVIQDFPVREVYSAPGHQNLREPGKMLGMSEKMDNLHTGNIFDGAEPIRLNVFTDTVDGRVVVKSIEVTDGNHRLAAGLHSGKWKSIKDIPQNYLKIEVNGFDTGGKQNPRWIPLEVVQASGIPRDQWFEVPGSWGAKGPTAQVRGDVSSLDESIPQKFRGVTLDKVIEVSLDRVHGGGGGGDHAHAESHGTADTEPVKPARPQQAKRGGGGGDDELTPADRAARERWEQTKPVAQLPNPPLPEAARAKIRKDVTAEHLAHRMAYRDVSEFTPEDHAYLKEQGLAVGQQIKGKNGLDMTTFVPIDGSGAQPVVAFRGTKGMADLADDVNPAGVGASQMTMNEGEIAQALASVQGYGKPIVTGHSLGGALAQMTAARFPEMVGRIVTFQSPGIPHGMVARIDAYNAKQEHTGGEQIEAHHYAVQGDLIPLAGEAFATGFLTHIDRGIDIIMDTPVNFNGGLFKEHTAYPLDEFVKTGEGLGSWPAGMSRGDGRGPASAWHASTDEVHRTRAGQVLHHFVEAMRVGTGRALEILERIKNGGRAPKQAYQRVWERVRTGVDKGQNPEQIITMIEGSNVREADKNLMVDQLRKILDARGARPGGGAGRSLYAPSPLASGSTPWPAVRRKADGSGVGPDATQKLAAAESSSGRPLPDDMRAKFEKSMGADLSAVRVHTGPASQDAARAVGARAFAVGQDVHFGEGQYDPESGEGQHLLAHEVAHTVQQRGNAPNRQHKLEVSSPQDAAEHEADRAADAAVSGAPAQITSAGAGAQVIARDADEGVDAKTYVAYGSINGIAIFGDLVAKRDALELPIDAKHARWGGTGVKGFLAKAFPLNLDFRRWLGLWLPGGFPAVDALINKGRHLNMTGGTESTPATLGDKGPNIYSPDVAVELINALRPAIMKSLARMLPRYLDARAAAANKAGKCDDKGAPEPAPTDIVASASIDGYTAEGLCSGAIEFDWINYVAEHPDAGKANTIRPLDVTLDAVSEHSFWVIAKPKDGGQPATPEEVSTALYGSSTNALDLIAAPPRFGSNKGTILKSEWKDAIRKKAAAEIWEGACEVFLVGAGLGTDPVADLLQDGKKADLLAQEQASKYKATGATREEIIKRVGQNLGFVQAIDAGAKKLGIVGQLDAIQAQLKQREADIQKDPAEATKWDAHSAKQRDVLKSASDGMTGVVGFWDGMVDKLKDPAGKNVSKDIADLLKGAAQDYVTVAAQSHLIEIAAAAAAKAAEKNYTLPFDIIEAMLRSAARMIEEAAKHKGSPEAYDLDDMRKREQALRQRVSAARAQVLKDPSLLQHLVDELFAEVGDFQTEASLVANLDQLDDLINQFDDEDGFIANLPTDDGEGAGYVEHVPTLGEIIREDIAAIKVWRDKWKPVYAKWKATDKIKDAQEQKRARDQVKADIKALLADGKYIEALQHFSKELTDIRKAIAIMKIVLSIVAIIAITLVSMGAGLAMGSFATGLMAGAVEAGTITAATAGTIAGGAALVTEAAVFTALNTVFFAENPTWQSVTFEFGSNLAMFGALKAIGKAYRSAKVVEAALEGAKFGPKALALGGEMGVNFVTMNAALLAKEQIAHEVGLKKRDLTWEETKGILAQSTGMMIAMAIAGRAAAPLFTQLEKASASLGARISGMNMARAELFGAAVAAKANPTAENIANLVKMDKAELKNELEVFDMISKDPKALEAAGLKPDEIAAITHDAGQAVYQAKVNEALQVNATMVSAGQYRCTHAQKEAIVAAYGKDAKVEAVATDDVANTQTYTITPKEGPAIRLSVGESLTEASRVDATAKPKDAPPALGPESGKEPPKTSDPKGASSGTSEMATARQHLLAKATPMGDGVYSATREAMPEQLAEHQKLGAKVESAGTDPAGNRVYDVTYPDRHTVRFVESVTANRPGIDAPPTPAQAEAARKLAAKAAEIQGRRDTQLTQLIDTAGDVVADRVIIGGGQSAVMDYTTLKGAGGAPPGVEITNIPSTFAIAPEGSMFAAHGEFQIGQSAGELKSPALTRQPGEFTADHSGRINAQDFNAALTMTGYETGMVTYKAKVTAVEVNPRDGTWPHDTNLRVQVNGKYIYVNRVDGAMGLGVPKPLGRPGTKLAGGQEAKLLSSGKMVHAQEKLALPGGGEHVAVIGDGATGAWACEAALKSGAKKVYWFGGSPKAEPAPANVRAELKKLGLTDAQIDTYYRAYNERNAPIFKAIEEGKVELVGGFKDAAEVTEGPMKGKVQIDGASPLYVDGIVSAVGSKPALPDGIANLKFKLVTVMDNGIERITSLEAVDATGKPVGVRLVGSQIAAEGVRDLLLPTDQARYDTLIIGQANDPSVPKDSRGVPGSIYQAGKNTDLANNPEKANPNRSFIDQVRDGLTPKENDVLDQMIRGKKPDAVDKALGNDVAGAQQRVKQRAALQTGEATRTETSMANADDLKTDLANEGVMHTDPVLKELVANATNANMPETIRRIRGRIAVLKVGKSVQAEHPNATVYPDVQVWKQIGDVASLGSKPPPKHAKIVDGKVWLQVGDIDVLAVETMPPLAKQQVVHMGEVKTGKNDSPTDASSQIDANTAAMQKAATDPNAAVRLEANGVDISDQIDLTSATRDKGKTHGPLRPPAGPRDKVFDNDLGITTEDLDRVAKALLHLEQRGGGSSTPSSGSIP